MKFLRSPKTSCRFPSNSVIFDEFPRIPKQRLTGGCTPDVLRGTRDDLAGMQFYWFLQAKQQMTSWASRGAWHLVPRPRICMELLQNSKEYIRIPRKFVQNPRNSFGFQEIPAGFLRFPPAGRRRQAPAPAGVSGSGTIAFSLRNINVSGHVCVRWGTPEFKKFL